MKQQLKNYVGSFRHITARDIFYPFGEVNATVYLTIALVEYLILLLVWNNAAGSLIPRPSEVWESFAGMVQSDEFYRDLVSSTSLTMKGMFLSLVPAALLCYVATTNIAKPILVVLTKMRYLTMTGLVFVFTIMFKNASDIKISLLMFGIIPFFITSFASVIASIPPEKYNLCTTLKFSKWRTLWEVIVVGKADALLDVIKQNFAIAWMMITSVEGLCTNEGGLGVMMIKSNKYIHLADVFAILLTVAIIGVLLDYVFGALRKMLFPYTRIK